MKQIILTLTLGLLMAGCNQSTTQTTTKPAVCPAIDKSTELMNKKAILDSIDAYNAALKNDSTPIDICMHAGKVKAAYERAKDYSDADVWNSIEKSDCKNAGL